MKTEYIRITKTQFWGVCANAFLIGIIVGAAISRFIYLFTKP